MTVEITRRVSRSGKRDLLKKLTLVLPTYNRQSFALRNMRYWSGKGVQLIVIDGSECPIPSESLDNLKNNIHYQHMATTLAQRLSFACELIDTEYVSMLGDDEFYLPTGLESSIYELELDASLVACMGRAVTFNLSRDGEFLDANVCYPKHAGYEITGESSGERMFNNMNRYVMSNLWSVVRRDVFRDSHAAFLRKPFLVYALWELQFELSVSYFGKSKIIPVLHWLRSNENPGVAITDSEFDSKNSLNKWWVSSKEQSSRKDFLTVTSEVLSEVNGRNRAEVANEIECAMNAYHAQAMENLKRVRYFDLFKRKIKSSMRPSLVYPLKCLLNPLVRFDWPKPVLSVARKIEGTGVEVDFKELSNIEDIVVSFYAKRGN